MRHVLARTLLALVLILTSTSGSLQAQVLIKPSGKTSRPSGAQKANLFRQALRLEAAGQLERATALYKQLFEQDPRNASYLQGVMRCLKRMKAHGELEDFLQDALMKRPGDPLILAELASVRYRAGAKDEALQMWRGVLKDSKPDERIYRAVAGAMLENGLRDEAMKVYKEGRQKLGSPALFTFELANLYLSRRDYRGATREYLRYLRERPQQEMFISGNVNSFCKETDALKVVIDEVRKAVAKHPDLVAYRLLLADLYLRGRMYPEALEEYVRAERKLTDRQRRQYRFPLFRFAQTALRQGALDYARQAFHLVIKMQPGSREAMRAQLGLAQALAEEGKMAEAVAAYRNFAVRYPKASEAREALYRAARLFWDRLQQPDSAAALAEVLTLRYPNSRYALQAGLLLANCALARGDYNGARRRLEDVVHRARKRWPDLAEEARFRLAELFFYQAQWDSALTHLKQVATPPRLAKGAGAFANDAIRLMLLIQGGRNVDPGVLSALAKARLDIAIWKPEQAEALLRQKLKERPDSPLADRVWYALAGVLDTLGRKREALQVYQQLAEKFPESLLADAAQLRAAEIAEQLGDVEAARRAYELLLTNYPKSVYLEKARKRLRALGSS